MYTHFLQKMPYIGRVRYREVSSRGNVIWDLKMMSTVERCSL